jgi:hypothetical protein
MSHLHTQHLASLVDVVALIDDVSLTPAGAEKLIEAAHIILGEMKMELLDIGNLENIFQRMQWAPEGTSQAKTAHVLEAHNEIQRLLGDQIHTIYCQEEACHA